MQFLWHEFGTVVTAAAVFVVVWFIASLKLWPQRLRKFTSSSWSTALATIEGGDVSRLQSSHGGVATCTLNYSYQVNGDYYGGTHSQQFFDEQAAYDFIDSRKGKAAQIKYNPRGWSRFPDCCSFENPSPKNSSPVNTPRICSEVSGRIVEWRAHCRPPGRDPLSCAKLPFSTIPFLAAGSSTG